MKPPRWLLVILLVVTDAAAIWYGVRNTVDASFLLVLAGTSATLALTTRPRLAASATLALLLPAVFLTVMAGPGTTADCGARCTDLVDSHTSMVARVAWILAIGHLLAFGLSYLDRLMFHRGTPLAVSGDRSTQNRR